MGIGKSVSQYEIIGGRRTAGLIDQRLVNLQKQICFTPMESAVFESMRLFTIIGLQELCALIPPPTCSQLFSFIVHPEINAFDP